MLSAQRLNNESYNNSKSPSCWAAMMKLLAFLNPKLKPFHLIKA